MLSLRLAKFPTFLLLVLLIANILTITILSKHQIVTLLILAPINMFALQQILILFGTIPAKKKAVLRLASTNRSTFKPNKFAEYMNAPCSRQVAKIALERIGQVGRYPELKRDFQKSLFAPRGNKRVRVTFAKNDKTSITDL